MRKVNREKINSIEVVPLNRTCCKCDKPAVYFLMLKTWFGGSRIPVCEEHYKKFMDGELNL